RRKSQTREHGGGDSDGRSESRCAFDKRPERKGDEQGLQSSILGEAADGVFHDLKFAGLHRDVVQQDRGENDPADREKAERRAVSDSARELAGMHAISAKSYGGRGRYPGQ